MSVMKELMHSEGSMGNWMSEKKSSFERR